MKKTVCFVLGAAVVVAALSVAGRADYEEAVASQQRYCDRVAAGHWPDFRGNYATACRGG